MLRRCMRHVSRPRPSCRGKGTIAVAMSGGIDSSYSALLLKEQGYDVVGVFMRNWDVSEEDPSSCQSDRDWRDMQEVCVRLGIRHLEVGFVKEYWLEVFLPFLETYKSGVETPNPDVYCNKFVKFNHFKRYAKEHLGIGEVATGHYARTSELAASDACGPGPLLRTAVDKTKDQSYFLCHVQSEQLRGVRFPLGEALKRDVAAAAAAPFSGLRVLAKPQSMGVCFIGKRSMPHFLSQYFSPTKGRFVDADTGAVLGPHEGKELYTVGQGARIAGQPEPYFVVRRERGCVDVFVARGKHNPLLYSDRLSLKPGSLSWLAGCPPAEGTAVVAVQFKSRHNQPVARGWLQLRDEVGLGSAVLSFERPQRAITPGQVCALYDSEGDVCLGGGIILAGGRG